MFLIVFLIGGLAIFPRKHGALLWQLCTGGVAKPSTLYYAKEN